MERRKRDTKSKKAWRGTPANPTNQVSVQGRPTQERIKATDLSQGHPNHHRELSGAPAWDVTG